MRVFLVALVVVAAAGALAASTADARIVPQRGIAGVTLGMSQAQVRAVLGRPTHIERGTNEFGPYVDFHYDRLQVTFQGLERVTFVTTTRRTERTRAGVGVGSTERDVRKRVAGVRCRTEGMRMCVVGQLLPGRRVTVFFVRLGRVFRVDVGIVID